MLYTTEKCNLTCTYCEDIKERNKLSKNKHFDQKTLISTLNKIPNLTLHFYGGEPLLNINLIKNILNNVNYDRVTLQTNGTLLHNLDIK